MTSAWDCSLSLGHGHILIPDHTFRIPIIFRPLQVHTLLSDSNVERQARENGHLYLPPLWLEIQLSTHIPIGELLQWAGKPWKDEDLRKAALASCTKLFSVHRASVFPQCPSRSLPLWLALQNKAQVLTGEWMNIWDVPSASVLPSPDAGSVTASEEPGDYCPSPAGEWCYFSIQDLSLEETISSFH